MKAQYCIRIVLLEYTFKQCTHSSQIFHERCWLSFLHMHWWEKSPFVSEAIHIIYTLYNIHIYCIILCGFKICIHTYIHNSTWLCLGTLSWAETHTKRPACYVIYHIFTLNMNKLKNMEPTLTAPCVDLMSICSVWACESLRQCNSFCLMSPHQRVCVSRVACTEVCVFVCISSNSDIASDYVRVLLYVRLVVRLRLFFRVCVCVCVSYSQSVNFSASPLLSVCCSSLSSSLSLLFQMDLLPYQAANEAALFILWLFEWRANHLTPPSTPHDPPVFLGFNSFHAE